ncbi:MAG: galactokinase [Alicyclobacillus sp.]|nr:galactokinase [Alicyclobacillus sp.]
MNDWLKMEQFLEFSPGDVKEVRAFFAPGRVNLIGEHIDYNGGLVFPAALDMGTWVLVRPRQDGVVRFASTAFPERVTRNVAELCYAKEDGFANYPKGVVWALREAGVQFSGGDFLFHGNLPTGAGLSSSASIEVATAVAVNALANGSLSGVEIARLCQRAENEFVGVNSGIMDQFASAMGKAAHAILLDCDSLKYQWIPFHFPDHRLVIANSNKQRGLTDSKYNERRAECDAALAALRERMPGLSQLTHLSTLNWGMVEDAVRDPVLQRRVRHVITENERVHRAAAALEENDIVEFGSLMNASHRSLRNDYEVTGPELDALVEAAWACEGCVGSRMTGAGFGGCTVSVVRADAVASFCAQVGDRYQQVTGLKADFYVSVPAEGAREVELPRS